MVLSTKQPGVEGARNGPHAAVLRVCSRLKLHEFVKGSIHEARAGSCRWQDQGWCASWTLIRKGMSLGGVGSCCEDLSVVWDLPGLWEESSLWISFHPGLPGGQYLVSLTKGHRTGVKRVRLGHKPRCVLLSYPFSKGATKEVCNDIFSRIIIKYPRGKIKAHVLLFLLFMGTVRMGSYGRRPGVLSDSFS